MALTPAEQRTRENSVGVPGTAHVYAAPGVDWRDLDPAFLKSLDALSTKIGRNIEIFSGYRTPAHSVEVGGYSNDPHTRGVAVDAYALADSNIPLGQYASQSVFGSLGLESGFYWKKSDPAHVQVLNSGVNKSITTLGAGGTTPAQSSGGPALSFDEQAFVEGVSLGTGVDKRVLTAWERIEGAYAPSGTGGHNYLNLRPYQGDNYASVSPGGFEQFATVTDAVTATVRRIKQPFADPIERAAQRGASPREQIAAIASTGWDVGHYGGTGGPALLRSYTGLYGANTLGDASGDSGGSSWYSGITGAAGDAAGAASGAAGSVADAAGSVAGAANDAARHIPGVAQAEGVAKDAVGFIGSVDDAIRFLFSVRFLEILGGMGLVGIGIFALAKDSTVVQAAAGVASKGATGAASTVSTSREAGRRPKPAAPRPAAKRRPSMPVREPTAGTAYDRVQPATGDPIPY